MTSPNEDPVSFAPDMTWCAFLGEGGVHSPRHREAPILIGGREGPLCRARPDGPGPVVRAQRIAREGHDLRRFPRLLPVRSLEGQARPLIARPKELEPIEFEKVPDPEHGGAAVLVVELKVVLVETNEPEQTGEMEDRIRIVDVLAVGRAEIVNL